MREKLIHMIADGDTTLCGASSTRVEFWENQTTVWRHQVTCPRCKAALDKLFNR